MKIKYSLMKKTEENKIVKRYSVSNKKMGIAMSYTKAATAKAHARRWSATHKTVTWIVTRLDAKPGTLAVWEYRKGQLTKIKLQKSRAC